MNAAPQFHVILFQPEIPPNTGNVIRLCANTGAQLHLVEPLGFALEDKQLKRAGLDYHEYSRLQVHPDLDTALARIAPNRLFALSTRASVRYDSVAFEEGDAFLFGPESRGLPQDVLDALPDGRRLRLPMRPDNRSLNLSNTVAVVMYEAWRQHGLPVARSATRLFCLIVAVAGACVHGRYFSFRAERKVTKRNAPPFCELVLRTGTCAPRPAGDGAELAALRHPRLFAPAGPAVLGSLQGGPDSRAVDPCHAWMRSAWINQGARHRVVRNACDCPQKKTPGHQYRHAHRTCPSPLPSGRSRRMRLSVHLHVSR